MKKTKTIKKIIMFLLLVLMFFVITNFEYGIVASATSEENSIYQNNTEDNLLTYSQYYEKYKNKLTSNKKYVFTPNESLSIDDNEKMINQAASFNYSTDTVKLTDNESATFLINVEEEGLYAIYFDYYFLTDSIISVEAQMNVNDEYPYYESRQLLFKADFFPSTADFKKDRYGNEIVPSSIKDIKWYEKQALQDGSLLNSGPMLIYLKANEENKVTLMIKSGDVLIGKIYCESKKDSISYDEYITKYQNEKKATTLLKIPAEYIYSKSDISVRQYSARELGANRYDSLNRLLNCIYHDSWKKGNQEITWEVDIEESGLYNLSFKYYQTGLIDLPVQRTILINGNLEFEELKNYNFYYAKNWKNESLHNDEGLLYVYLEKGLNKISMKTSLDYYKVIIEEIDQIMDEMTEVSLQIKYLNNGQEDKYRQWNILDYIPNLKEQLEEWITELEETIAYGNKLSKNKKGSSSFSNIKLAIKKLRKLANDPNSIPNELNTFTDGTSSISSLLGNTISSLRENPLGLEMIYLGSENVKLPKERANFFARVWEGVKRFFLSFFYDEYSIGSSDEEIEVWVNRSRQYIEIMQQMVDEAGLNVRFSIMPDESKLILANSAGNLPDVAMGVSNWIPYDLAIRDITVNLREYDGFDEVINNMSKGTMIPYAYEDGIYGLPETQDFWVLYIRDDIFNNLGFEVPSTWDDLVKLLPKLQSRGLNFYSPISAYTGLKPFVATMPLINQYGVNLYSDDGMSVNLDSEENIAALKFMTNLFTIYNVPEEVPNFYNSFRQGTLPIGIGNSATYVQLSVAAPEIQGNWKIYPHIGNEIVVDGKEQIVRYSSCNSQGLTMFKASDKKDQSWEFIKWWLDTNTQERFIETLYSIYGLEYLYFTSNNEAFKSIPIPKEQKDVIVEQLSWAAEASRIPAAYMVERSISDAYSKIVFNGVNPRIALDDATIEANREIERKMEEFGYMKNGEKVKDYKVPTIYNIQDWLSELR